MYDPAGRLNGFTDSLTQIINAGAQAYKTATAPNYGPYSLPPFQGPSIDPRSGAYVPPPYPFPGNIFTPPDFTVPLLIGGGLLVLYLAGRKPGRKR